MPSNTQNVRLRLKRWVEFLSATPPVVQLFQSRIWKQVFVYLQIFLSEHYGSIMRQI